MSPIKINKRLLIYFITILNSAAITACNIEVSSGPPDDKKMLHEKTFQIEAGKKLVLTTSTGDVTITGWDKNEVYVKVLGDDDAKERMHFEFESDDESVTITGKKEGSFFSFFTSGIELSYEINVPSEFNSVVKTSGDDIRFGDVAGNQKLETSGGDLWIVNTAGVLEAHTSGGDINFDRTSGKLDLGTSGGDIKGTEFEGDISVSTSGGDIVLRGSNSKVYAETSGGDITLDFSGTNKGIDLETSGGDIMIMVPPDFNASAKLYTSGGDVSCDLTMNNAGKISSHKLEADLNNGGELLNAETSGGDIDVRKK